jgi:hypothetical protein
MIMADADEIFEEEQSTDFFPAFVEGLAKGVDTPKDLLVDLPLGVFQAGSNIVQGKSLLEDTVPNVPGMEDALHFLTDLEQSQNEPAKWTGIITGGFGSAAATIAFLNKIKATNKPLYRKLTRAYPFSVGQFHVAATATPNSAGWLSKIHNMFKGTIPTKKVLAKVAKNFLKLGVKGGLLGSLVTSDIGEEWGGHGSYEAQVEAQNAIEAEKLKAEEAASEREEQELLKLLEELNATATTRDQILEGLKAGGVVHRAYGSPEEGELGSGIVGDDPYFDLKELDLGPAFEGIEDLDIFEETKKSKKFDIFEEAKKEGHEEIEVAGAAKEILLGKVPIWAVGNVEKAKMLLQNLTKNEKSILKSITEKLGLTTYKGKKVEDIVEDIDIFDTPSGGQEVVMKKSVKTISDSPEDAESAFYSSVEAKMMDPNTPDSFASVDDFYKFANTRGISKAEIDDNILSRYIASSKKNGTPLIKEEMLDIIRQSPMRKIRTKNYGWLGEGEAKYAGGNMEGGLIPGTYRESVLYLDYKDIPLDPGKLPPEFGSAHSFPERYVIGWSRLSDRMAKLPVEKGVTATIDPKQMKLISKNVKKVQSQVDGLYASAYSKLFRKGEIDLQPVDQLNSREIKDIVNQYTFDLEALDAPLFKQIKQFEDKLTADTFKLNKMKEATKGAEIRVTFADEIQSDVLQNAQRQSQAYMKTFGDLLDKSVAERAAAILKAKSSYSSDLGKIDPTVAEYFIQNKSVFRPIFQTEQEMQQFIDVFAKNKIIFEKLKNAGVKASPDLFAEAKAGQALEKKMLEELQVSLSPEAMMQLQPNVPFKDRSEWGEALIKRDLYQAATRLFVDKSDDAATWYAISPSKLIRDRYGQSGSVATPLADRTKDMKGIGMDEFYGGPNSVAAKTWQIVDPDGRLIKGKFASKDEARQYAHELGGGADYMVKAAEPKHYTSVLEKALQRAAKENNSEIKKIKVKIGDNKYVDSYAIKLTPEMLLPHKTHRKDGGMVYTPEIIDIFEAA